MLPTHLLIAIVRKSVFGFLILAHKTQYHTEKRAIHFTQRHKNISSAFFSLLNQRTYDSAVGRHLSITTFQLPVI